MRAHLQRYCIPCELNDHQPHILREHSLLFFALVITVAKLAVFFSLAFFPSVAVSSEITQNRLFSMTNSSRAAAGLPAYSYNSALERAATNKANDMMALQYFAHTSPTGVSPWYWIRSAGYDYTVAGENLAIDFYEAEDVHAAWLASATHRANILHSGYTEIGIGVARGVFDGQDTVIAVQMFGTPAAAPAPEPEPEPEPEPAPSSSNAIASAPSQPSSTPSASTPVVSGPTEVEDVVELTVPQINDALSYDSTDPTMVTLSGVADAGVELTLSVDGAAIEDTVVATDEGTFAFTFDRRSYETGTHTFQVRGVRDEVEVVSPEKEFVLDNDAPTIALVSSCPDRYVDTPSNGIVFGSEQGASIEVAASPDVSYELEQLTNGNYALTFADFPESAIDVAVTLSDEAGNTHEETFMVKDPNQQDESRCDGTPRVLGVTFDDFQNITQRVIGFVGMAVLLMLLMNIVIKVRIQHPTVVVNAVSFLVFAFVLFVF